MEEKGEVRKIECHWETLSCSSAANRFIKKSRIMVTVRQRRQKNATGKCQEANYGKSMSQL